MASSYPSGLDSFDTIASDKKTSDTVGGRTHRAMHNDLGDAIEAVQAELGTDPAGASATVKARFEAIEANDWVTSARIAANAVGSSELADNAVDTNAIADAAVTPAKLATSGRFTFPTGAANGYGFTSGAVNLSGTGTPESVVTAAPGSTWLQTDSTTDVKGWIRWVKATGTGSTGWVAGPEADTGWRDVSADLLNGWKVNTADGGFRVRRIGNVVTLQLHVYDGTVSTNIWAAPTGFRPSKNTYFAVSHLTTGAAIGGGYWPTAGGIQRFTSNAAAYNTITVVTNEAWPSSLPGSAA